MILREEDLRTSVHNFMTRIGGFSSHWFDAINLSPFISGLQLIDINREDVKYFNSLYKVSAKLNSMLLHMCKKTGGYKFTEKEYNEYSRNNADRSIARDMTYFASRDIGKGMLTTSTVAQVVPDNNGFYVVYYTFDSTNIEDCKVVCYHKDIGFYLKEIPQWTTVNPNLYRL